MATNLNLPPELLDEVKRAGNFKTKRAAVIEILEEFLRRQNRRKALELFGQIDFDPDYDYKAERLMERNVNTR